MEFPPEEGKSWPSSAPKLMIPADFSDWMFIGHFESKRTYVFPAGEMVVDQPQALKVSASGGHRLTTFDNKAVYIPPGFIGIEIDGQWAEIAEDQGGAQDYHDL